MEMYFLKSAACLATLLIFYKLLLESIRPSNYTWV